MEENFQESSGVQEEQGVHPSQDLDWILNGKQDQRPECFKQDPLGLHSNPDQVDGQGKVEVSEHLEPSEKQIQEANQDPPQIHGGCQEGTLDSCLSLVHQKLIQDLDRASPQGQNQTQHHLVHHRHSDQDQDQDLMTTVTSDETKESGGVPALVVTQAEETKPAATQVTAPVNPSGPQRPADLVPVTDLSSGSDGGDMTCSDLLSLRSDSLSLTSEPNVSRRCEEDDTGSVTASSVMSLFHRVQLDPLEKAWLKSSAVGNTTAQRQLLEQEPSLVLKKTALHWAAKQGRQDVVDMMICSGADVNVKSGYTALHLAAIHGHQHIVHTLINTHNAKTSLRDYHGKMAVQYWSGCRDIFNKRDSQSEGRFSRGRRRTQRYALPSLLLSRSRSQGQLNLEFGAVLQSSSHDALDLQL